MIVFFFYNIRFEDSFNCEINHSSIINIFHKTTEDSENIIKPVVSNIISQEQLDANQIIQRFNQIREQLLQDQADQAFQLRQKKDIDDKELQRLLNLLNKETQARLSMIENSQRRLLENQDSNV